MKKILVLMATYNGASWLPEQLDSVLRQAGVDPCIVASDDGSTDGTAEVLRAYLATGALRVVDFNAVSGGAGQNFLRLLRTVSVADFDYVAFCDQDDVWLEGKLSRAVRMLGDCNASGYSSSVTAFWPSGSTRLLCQQPKVTDIDYLFEGAGQGCTFVLTANLARRVQTFLIENPELTSKIHYHDWLIYALARAFNQTWAFDSDPSMQYRQHQHNDTGARGAPAAALRRLSLIRSGWYRTQVQLLVRVIDSTVSDKEVLPADFRSIWHKKSGLCRRLQLARILFRRGRRRAGDRAVLAVSAIMGWI